MISTVFVDSVRKEATTLDVFVEATEINILLLLYHGFGYSVLGNSCLQTWKDMGPQRSCSVCAKTSREERKEDETRHYKIAKFLYGVVTSLDRIRKRADESS